MNSINPIVFPATLTAFALAEAKVTAVVDNGERFTKLTGRCWPDEVVDAYVAARKDAVRAMYNDAQWAERSRLLAVSDAASSASVRADYELEDARAAFELADKTASAYWSEEIEAELADAAKELTRAEAEAKRCNDEYYRSVIDFNEYCNHIQDLNDEREVSCD